MKYVIPLLYFIAISSLARAAQPIETTSALVAAVRDAGEGATIEVGSGTFELESQLELKSGMALSRRMIAAVKAAGGEPEYTEFPDVGHGSWDAAYATAGLWEWVFKQHR